MTDKPDILFVPVNRASLGEAVKPQGAFKRAAGFLGKAVVAPAAITATVMFMVSSGGFAARDVRNMPAKDQPFYFGKFTVSNFTDMLKGTASGLWELNPFATREADPRDAIRATPPAVTYPPYSGSTPLPLPRGRRLPYPVEPSQTPLPPYDYSKIPQRELDEIGRTMGGGGGPVSRPKPQNQPNKPKDPQP